MKAGEIIHAQSLTSRPEQRGGEAAIFMMDKPIDGVPVPSFRELETIINSAPNSIVAVDENGFIKVWNSSAEKLLGRKAADVIGRNIQEVMPASGLGDVIETGLIPPAKKLKINNHCFISNRAPLTIDGRIVGAVAVLQDISDMEKMFPELLSINNLHADLDAVRGNSTYILVTGIIPLKDAVESVEKQLLEKVYRKHRTTRQMAKELEVDASTIVRKAAKYNISHCTND